jgi:ATP-dependent protease HslVU (ClpYQ) ATPase subunit
MEIIIYLVVFFAGVVLGWYRGVHNMARMMLEEPEKFQELMQTVKRAKLEAKLDEDMENDRETEIDVEREEGIYYAYSSQGEFLAQGPDFRTMIEVIKKRFPGRSFRINRYNPKLTEEETQRLIISVYEAFGKTPPEELNQNS